MHQNLLSQLHLDKYSAKLVIQCCPIFFVNLVSFKLIQGQF